MPLRSKQRLVLVKTEGGTYGTDPSPTGSNALYILEPRDLSHHAPATEPLSPATQAIREAVDAVFALSSAPPTTEEVAAAALRAAADHLRWAYANEEYVDSADDWLDDIAAELDGHHG